MTTLIFKRVLKLPATLEANAFYMVRSEDPGLVNLYITGNDPSDIRHIVAKEDVLSLITGAISDLNQVGVDKLSTARKISLTGDGTAAVTFDGSKDVSGALTLKNSGVTAGEYPVVTVNTKGLVTTGRVLAEADIPSLSTTKIKAGTLANDISGNAASATKLQNAVTINGVSFDGTKNIVITSEGQVEYIPLAQKGKAGGVATLDEAGIILAEQLPSYVDEIKEYENLAAFPATGEKEKIYVAKDTDKIYRWSGSAYIPISDAVSVADEAIKLVTKRKINGTDFDGSAAITTAQWGAARNITIGSKTASVNGSADVSFTLAEIGAAPASAKGTVTSVGMTVPTGLEVTGSPITSNGTFAVTLATGRVIPTSDDVNKGVTAHGWGNHASAGYSKTDTKYTAGDGLTLTGTAFSLPVTVTGTGTYVQSVAQTANGLEVTLGTPPNTNTTYSTATLEQLTAGTDTTGRLQTAKLLNDWVATKGYVTTDTKYTAGTGVALSGTAFSVKYGTEAGTAAQGNDSRINNGQTAFGWGNHASAGYSKTDTKYTAGNGLTLTGTAFSLPVTVSGTGTYVQSVTQTANGITVTLGTPPNTTYTVGTLEQLTAGTDTAGRLQTAKALNDWLTTRVNELIKASNTLDPFLLMGVTHE